MNEKGFYNFVIWDIKRLYQFIKELLLKPFLDFAEKRVKVSNEDKALIKFPRKSLLFKKQQT